MRVLLTFPSPGEQSSHDVVTQLERLAATFKLEPGLLIDQYRYLRPIAKNLFKFCKDSSKAWVGALERILADPHNRASHPMGDLQACLAEWMTYLATTAGVEKNFSMTRKGIHNCQLHMGTELENIYCKVRLGDPAKSIYLEMCSLVELWKSSVSMKGSMHSTIISAPR